MSHVLLKDNRETLCGLCGKKTYWITLNLRFCWLHTMLYNTFVIFTSLCYLCFLSWWQRTPEHFPLHINISMWGAAREAVSYNRDIPAGNSFSQEVRVGCVCWGCFVASNTVSPTLHSFPSHCLSLLMWYISFSWMALDSNTWPTHDPQLSLHQNTPGSTKNFIPLYLRSDLSSSVTAKHVAFPCCINITPW